MKKFSMKYTAKLFTFFSVFMLLSCETTDLDLQDDPSRVSPDQADPDLILNTIQLEFVKALNFNEDNEDGLNVRASEFVRMQHLFGNYTGPFTLSETKINDAWRDIYANALQDVKALNSIAEPLNLQGHIAVAKIIEAYVLVTLTDIFGKAPFSEAFSGNENKNPKLDDGEELYATALQNLDEAIAALKVTEMDDSIDMPADLFYNGNEDAWIKCANTIKLKMLLQTRLVDSEVGVKFNTLLDEPIIENTQDNFLFQYSNVEAPADSRHPYYSLNYGTDGADDYLNSYYVNLLLNDKSNADPRLRYYFYRQTTDEPEGDNLPCSISPVQNFCYIGDLYWTRDHGAQDGVPSDGLLRSTYGIYPFGGAFDNDSFTTVANNSGAGGGGIFPILLNFYTHFMIAELELTVNNDIAEARSRLEMAIRESISTVINFKPDGNTSIDIEFRPSVADIDTYVDEVLQRYDTAMDENARLDVIIKEYYIALWGNGIEAYNNYRRTSFPSDISDPVINASLMPRSFLYPGDATELNSSINQKNLNNIEETRVFWDTNTDELK